MIKAIAHSAQAARTFPGGNAQAQHCQRIALKFWKNLLGFVFYAVPHNGSNLAALLGNFPFSHTVQNLAPRARDTRWLNMQKLMYRKHNTHLLLQAYEEGKKTYGAVSAFGPAISRFRCAFAGPGFLC